MRVLVTGVKGQLGYDVEKELKRQGYDVIGVDRGEMDLLDNQAIERYIFNVNPDAIVHCAAYTAVDKAEEEKEICFQVNAESVRVISQCARELQSKLIYISTDYVFDGTKTEPYVETDIPNPINVYGASKLKGEQYVQSLLDEYYIVRISWVFGINGHNFVKTMCRLGESRSELTVIDDQIGSPTSTEDLAPLLVKMLKSDKYGIYHVTNEGFCSWYEFAKEIFKNQKMMIHPIKTAQYPTLAKRPLNSRMSKEKLHQNGFERLPSWEISLERYLENLQ